MTPSASTTVAIAGGGPAGVVLGLLLARAGIEVTVFEKHGDFFRDFRGDTVHPVTLTLLEDLGLYDKFAKIPRSVVEKGEYVIGGRKVTVADFTRLHEPHPMLAVAPQWDLLNLLAEAGKAEPTFTLLMNTEVTGILRDGEKVAGVRYQSPDGPGELHADLTVAADGRTSAVRRDAGLVPKEFSVPFDVGWFRLDTITPIKYQLTPRSAPGISLAMIPRPGYFQTGLFLPKGSEAQLHARGLDNFRAQIAELIPEADANSLTSWDDIKILDVRVNRLHTWHQPGLLCIGDAAHAMSPVGGVGVNLAVADAVAAARILAEPLSQHRLTDADLAVVQKRRKLPTIISQTIQQLMQKGMQRTLTGGPPPKVPKSVARLAARVLQTFPAISVVPAYVVGVGFRPERCPDFARRSAQQ